MPLAMRPRMRFDGRDLAFYTNRPRVFARLWAIAGVRQHQTGDAEVGALFIPETLETVVAVIKAVVDESDVRGGVPTRIQPRTQDDFRSLETTMFERRGLRAGRVDQPAQTAWEMQLSTAQGQGVVGAADPLLIGRRATHDSRGGDSLTEEPAKLLAVAPIVDST